MIAGEVLKVRGPHSRVGFPQALLIDGARSTWLNLVPILLRCIAYIALLRAGKRAFRSGTEFEMQFYYSQLNAKVAADSVSEPRIWFCVLAGLENHVDIDSLSG